MQTQELSRLKKLRAMVEKSIPENASSENVWEFLDMKNEHKHECELAMDKYGIDIRPIIAPKYSEVVSVIPDGHKWSSVLKGQDSEFTGQNTKARVLSVIDSALLSCLDA